MSLQNSLNNRMNCQRNKVLLLNKIRLMPGISRKQLSQELRRTPATISEIVGELIAQELICEEGVTPSIRGRKPIRLNIKDRQHYFLALDIDSEKFRVAVMDFNADILEMGTGRITDYQGLENRLDAVHRMAMGLLQQYGLQWDQIEAVGCAIAAYVHPQEHYAFYSANLPEWEDLPIRRIFEEKFQLPCYIDDRSAIISLAEKYYGVARGVGNFIFLSLAIGIAMKIYVDGNLYRGVNGSAGHIGHFPVVEEGV